MSNLITRTVEGVAGWVNDRAPGLVPAYKKHMSEYYAPKNFNLWYYFGSLALLVLVVDNTVLNLAIPSLIAMINTLAIGVLERRREIGMLRAVGATRRDALEHDRELLQLAVTAGQLGRSLTGAGGVGVAHGVHDRTVSGCLASALDIASVS